MSQQFHHIPSLLKPEELVSLEILVQKANFIDGKATASMAAKEVKNNLQLDNSDPDVMSSIQQLLNNAIQTSPYFNVAAQPKKVHPFIISKYGQRQFYGWHVDSPMMGSPAIRTDLAMTIFLSDPATYEGGELLIQVGNQVSSFKPAKGDAILYPCQFLHCVNEIKSGERMAAVTWIQSNVKDPEQREILFQLNQIHGSLYQQAPHAMETNLLLQTHSNLFRMWADV